MFKEPKKTMLKKLEACMTTMTHQIKKTTKETKFKKEKQVEITGVEMCNNCSEKFTRLVQ